MKKSDQPKFISLRDLIERQIVEFIEELHAGGADEKRLFIHIMSTFNVDRSTARNFIQLWKSKRDKAA